MHIFNLNLPKNKGLIPYAEFKLYKKHLSTQFIGFNSISLYKILPKLLEDEDEQGGKKKKDPDEESEETILDV